MKKTGFILTFAACFVGVFGALQADKWISAHNKPDDIFLESKPSYAKITQTTGETLPTPAFDFREAAKRAMPSVVSVDRYDKTRGFFDSQATERETGTGSGVIVSSDGIVVTNNHVVKGTQTRGGDIVYPRVQVRLYDGRSVAAKVLGTDERSDIAVLKIEAKDLHPIELGSSSNLEVGEWVMAVGNPLGFDNTVSVGVVSSTKRNLPVGDQGLVEGIQTDAAINPGNSGGALCNAQGQLVGINSAIASGTGESVGIGFAIPIDRAKKIVNDIVKFGHAKYPMLGISYDPQLVGQMDNPYARDYLSREVLKRDDYPNYGLLVRSVSGPAQNSGIAANDILLEVDGQKIDSSFDLNKVLLPKKVGDKVSVKYWHDGQTKQTSVTLEEMPTNI
ncbi:MAG: trypsin-like peptidase domain-containing protein [Armatimonadetes bacterium]|nr:trypsin-like serine protease [Armatimonadota bacterium]MBS1702204.1 trypsin-like peptidase domain-containing protein [Armatimonadota bacterium]MBS1727036.1 trypsin-like peptidase domain-containing protein [Armatimonadota bacterium]